MLEDRAPHRFTVGDTVMVKALPRDEPAQAFAVVRLMPVDDAGTPQYRIRGVSTGLERFVREVEIDALEAGGPRP